MIHNWYPKATAKPTGIDGGSMVGGPPRGVLHETQTTGEPGYNYGKTEPTMTLMPDGEFIQYVPFGRAARALKNLSGGVETNRQGDVCVQIEVVAYSDRNDWTPAQVAALREFVVWADTNLGIPAVFPRALDAPRMTFNEWLNATGWFDHGMVPENTHYDVGMEAGVAAVFDGLQLEVDMPGLNFITMDDRGESVEVWQRILNSLGETLPTDGIPTADMQLAVRNQTGVYINPSSKGLIGPTQMAILLSKMIGEPGPQGVQGPQGEKGDKGDTPTSFKIVGQGEVVT